MPAWISIVQGSRLTGSYEDGFRVAVHESEIDGWLDLAENFLELEVPAQDCVVKLEDVKALVHAGMAKEDSRLAYSVQELVDLKQADLQAACEATRDWLNGDYSPETLHGGEDMLDKLRKALGGYVYSPTPPGKGILR